MKTLFVLLFLATFGSASAQYTLTMNFTGMSPHTGHTLHIRVLNSSLVPQEVAHVRMIVPGSTFTVKMLALSPGENFTVDFYADFSMNGRYDAPPTDHAWRRGTGPVSGDITIDFAHNTNFTDINFPNPPDQYPSVIETEWTGGWTNTTFNTSGDGLAQFKLDYEARMITGSILLNGAFGSPTPTTIAGSGPFVPEEDSATMNVEAPLSGSLNFVKGKVSGVLTHSDFGVQMAIDGNYGHDQIMFTYAMSGTFKADGWMVLHRINATDVAEESAANATPFVVCYPNPATDVATISWDPSLGSTAIVRIVNTLGETVMPERKMETGERITTSSLPPGMYSVLVESKRVFIVIAH